MAPITYMDSSQPKDFYLDYKDPSNPTFVYGYNNLTHVTLEGFIRLRRHKPVRALYIEIEARIRTKNEWCTQGTMYSTTYRAEEDHFKFSKRLWEPKSAQDMNVSNLDIPFSIDVGKDMPSTLLGKYGKRSWCLRATLKKEAKIGGLPYKYHEVTLQVPNYVYHNLWEHNVRMQCTAPANLQSEGIFYNISTPSTVFGIGDIIPVNIFLTLPPNFNGDYLTGTMLAIQQHECYYSVPSEQGGPQQKDVNNYVTRSFNDPPAGQTDRFDQLLKITIPSDTPSSYTTKHIGVRHVLKVKFSFKTHSDIVVDIPIQVVGFSKEEADKLLRSVVKGGPAENSETGCLESQSQAPYESNEDIDIPPSDPSLWMSPPPSYKQEVQRPGNSRGPLPSYRTATAGRRSSQVE